MKYLNYSDVAIQPEYSTVVSRKKVNINTRLSTHQFESPIVPANMACTIDFKTAEMLDSMNCFYIMHRFISYADIISWMEKKSMNVYSVSVGVKPSDRHFIETIKEKKLKVDYITIDIAHGHCMAMYNMISFIRQKLGDNVVIIAGNVGTVQACKELVGVGADVIKVGLSYGLSCSTYTQTGVGTPMFTTIKEICAQATVPVIADGGIRCAGDACKALAAGATMVMAGSLFAACKDSPAPFIEDGNYIAPKRHKLYWGSASAKNKGHKDFVEGKELSIPCNEKTYTELYKEFNDGIKSFLSYIGKHEIQDAHFANFIEVSKL